MARQILQVGTTANDGTGDTLRAAMVKVNDNFTELYNSPLLASGIIVRGNEITATRTNDDLVLRASGTGSVTAGALKFKGTSISSDDSTAVNINENLAIDGTITATSFTGDGSALTGLSASSLGDLSVVGSTIIAPSNADITLAPAGTGAIVLPAITINDNNITGTRSNEDINITPSGTGQVIVPKLTIDSKITIQDNEITALLTNDDIVITPSGTGSVVMSKVDINGGAIDGATVGASSATTGVFTTVTANTSATVDGITLTDNEISANATNANLVLSGSGSGGVSISGFTFPTSDGSSGQFLKTDGSGTLSFATAGVTLNHSAIADGTTTLSASTTSNIDTFSASSSRSAKYIVSATNTEDGRFEIVEANITHDGTNAYIATFGSVTSGTEGLGTYSADINSGNVRFRCTPITSDSIVFKFQRIALNA